MLDAFGETETVVSEARAVLDLARADAIASVLDQIALDLIIDPAAGPTG